MWRGDRTLRYWWFQCGTGFLLFMICWFEKGSSVCPEAPCYNVCNPGIVDGNKVNVAFNKPANMSSRHENATMDFSGPACLVVNGNTSTTLVYLPPLNHNSIPNCVHSRVNSAFDTGDTNPWWQVDLGQDYTVTSFVIYGRPGQVARMRDAELQVDDQLCKYFPNTFNYPDSTTARIDSNCDTPRTGRRVTFKKTGTYNSDLYILNLCEIQIWVCRPGLYGQTCDRSCSWGCLNNQTCDNYYGICPNGCIDGYYGDVGSHGNKCESSCGQCAGDAACNKTTGHCPAGCRESGVQPPLCQQECQGYRWGGNCTMNCGDCKNSAACNKVDGSCVQCENHFQLPRCTECQAGYYGDDCSIPCGSCLNNDACDKSDGYCPNGCQPGYEGGRCKQECKNKMWGMNCSTQCGHCNNSVACNVFNGSCAQCQNHFQLPLCTECKDGYYGDTCRESCGSCLNNDACVKSDGHCPNRCQPGYQASLCKQECQEKTWGIDCAMKCGECKDSAACNIFNGSCGQCKDKLQPPMCTVCVGATYGENCSIPCGECQNAVCDRLTGKCDDGGCLEGYKGSRCDDDQHQEDSSNVGAIVGSVLGAAVFLAIVMIAGICWMRRSLKKAQSNTAQSSTGNVTNSASQNPHPGKPRDKSSTSAVATEDGVYVNANQDALPEKPSERPSTPAVATIDGVYVNVDNPTPNVYDTLQSVSSADGDSYLYTKFTPGKSRLKK